MPDLAALAAADEIEIETHATDGTVHRTIIWVVAHDATVYVRSVNGPGARWYREALADPSVALHVDGRRIAARTVPAMDPASVEACSTGLRDKYKGSYSLAAMLADSVLPTTLRLEAT